MDLIRTAILIVVIITGVGVAMLAGDYLGYKVGRMKLFSVVGVSWLAAIIVFAVVAAVKVLVIGQ